MMSELIKVKLWSMVEENVQDTFARVLRSHAKGSLDICCDVLLMVIEEQ